MQIIDKNGLLIVSYKTTPGLKAIKLNKATETFMYHEEYFNKILEKVQLKIHCTENHQSKNSNFSSRIILLKRTEL